MRRPYCSICGATSSPRTPVSTIRMTPAPATHIAMRATEHINVELRELAVACLRELTKAAPNAFADFVISTLPDGTEVASSPLVVEG